MSRYLSPCGRCGIPLARGGKNWRQTVLVCPDCREVDPQYTARLLNDGQETAA